MKKVLFAANLESFFLKFLIPQLEYFKKQGYEVHIASRSENLEIPYCDKKFDVSFARSLSIKDNVKSYRQMKKILKNEHYDIISCHTPFGAAITRLAAIKIRKKYKTRIIYTAHGFHFYKGAPKKNWLMFYPMEKILAKYTNDLITINKEDYKFAQKKLKTKVHYVPGVGIDPKKFDIKMTEKEKLELRKSLGLKKDDFIIIYPAEISYRKNQEWLINTLEKFLKEKNNVHLLLPGKDILNGKIEKQINNLGLNQKVHILGYRTDIPQLLRISNISVSSSRQEGLAVNIMEAMYTGLPIVATDCRGNSELIQNGKSGYIVKQGDSESFVKRINKIYEENNIKTIDKGKRYVKKYLIDNILKQYIRIYEKK